MSAPTIQRLTLRRPIGERYLMGELTVAGNRGSIEIKLNEDQVRLILESCIESLTAAATETTDKLRKEMLALPNPKEITL